MKELSLWTPLASLHSTWRSPYNQESGCAGHTPSLLLHTFFFFVVLITL